MLNDGWIEWNGGECPVDGCVIVETKWDDGDIIRHRASVPHWLHDDSCNIIAYRVIEE